MQSEPADPVRPAPDATSGRRRWTLLSLRVAVLLLILTCIWLIYPFAKIRICVSLVARSYDPVINPQTGGIDRLQRRARSNQHFSVEEELADQPLPALLELLASQDPVRVFVIGQAIEKQVTHGRYQSGLAGWRGKREPVQLEPGSLEILLDVIDQDLPRAAIEPLVGVLRHLRNQPQDRTAQFRDVMLKATERSSPESRYFGMQALVFMKLESDEALELVRRLANDPDDQVRERLFAELNNALRREFADHIPDHYREILQALFAEGSNGLKLSAVSGVSYMNLDNPETFHVVKSLLGDSAVDVRARTVRAILDAFEKERITSLPAEYAQAVSEVVPSIDFVHGGSDLVLKFVLAANVPREIQWQFIEGFITTEEALGPERFVQTPAGTIVPAIDSARIKADMINALFMPVPPERYSFSGQDWATLRDQFRTRALAAREDFLRWAEVALRSGEEATVIAGVHLTAAVAPDQLIPLISHPAPRVRMAALKLLRPSQEQIPMLLEISSDAESGVRGAMISALMQYEGIFTRKLIDQIMVAFRSEQNDYPIQEWIRLFKKMSFESSDLEQLIAESLKKRSMAAENWAVTEIKKTQETAKWLPQLLDGIGEGRLGLDSVLLVIDAGDPINSPEVAVQMVHSLTIPARAQPGAERVNPWAHMKQLVALCPPESVTDIVFDGLMSHFTSENYSAADAKRIAEFPIDREAFAARSAELLQSAQWELRRNGALTLSALGRSAKQATSRLVVLLSDDDHHVRTAAADALGSIGQDAGASAAAALAQMAKNDTQPGAQMAAIEAVAHMGPHLQPWIPTIDGLTRKGDRMVRDAATKVMQERKNAGN